MNTLTAEQLTKAQTVADTFNAITKEAPSYRHWFGFNDGGAASPQFKNYLRVLLRQHAGNETAESIREYFNLQRYCGEMITKGDVTVAVEVLKAL